MKKVLYILLLLVFFGCKTKTVTVDNTKEVKAVDYKKRLDSMAQVLVDNQLNYNHSLSLRNANWVLQTTPVLDSLGNRKPLNYKHYVNGELAEEIFLEGGELTRSNDEKTSTELEKKDEKKSENSNFKADTGIKSSEKAKSDNRNKVKKITDFSFSFYVWLFLIIIVILIMYWLSSYFKLPDKFSSLFNSKGG